jgi:4a-hydroxytetrahydrobiopterin dehydratase
VNEQGWRAFLEADGLEDWVVLHGGAAALFRVESLAAAADLARALADLDGLDDGIAILTMTSGQLTVRLTRGLFFIEDRHVELARAISATVRRLGAVADPSAVQEVQLAISARPDEQDLPFWRTVLGYAPLAGDNAIDRLGHASTIWLQDLDPAKPLRHAMHLDVSLAREEAEGRMRAAVEAGGRLVDESNAPGSWILADRAGNKVCIAAWPDGAATPGWAAEVGERTAADTPD